VLLVLHHHLKHTRPTTTTLDPPQPMQAYGTRLNSATLLLKLSNLCAPPLLDAAGDPPYA
jgi:hypothetical protein